MILCSESHLSVDGEEISRDIEAGAGVPHHGVADVDQARVDGLQVGDDAGQLGQEAPGADVAVDDVGEVVDLVCVQPVYQLLQLSVIKHLR